MKENWENSQNHLTEEITFDKKYVVMPKRWIMESDHITNYVNRMENYNRLPVTTGAIGENGIYLVHDEDNL